ncbi:hypothetical protein CHS0354_007853 [Potamilus streckersoni]|uniref:G-protein coupled receptors family 1 profile domain-containing protein n=1 Tax=Potamilus streckersoni TaxID=2493646 RepID=A0AAE0SJC0_9BIVA|nr:hypothetical protein CHS0354_007853 [Potamilus streckersoni]
MNMSMNNCYTNGSLIPVSGNETESIRGYSIPHIIIASIFVAIIMFVIVFGNLLVVVAIATDKNLKSTQHWFIASLAVADFLLGLVIMPFSLANELMGYWYFGYVWCDLWKAIDVLLCTASILSICLVSLDRYWSIIKPVEYSGQRTPTRAALMIAAVWILSAVICVPPLIGWKNPLPEADYPLCLLSADIGYVLYSTMGSFYIPCVIMVFVYGKIFIAARSRARRNMGKNSNCSNVNEIEITKSATSSSKGLTNGRRMSCETVMECKNYEESIAKSAEVTAVVSSETNPSNVNKKSNLILTDSDDTDTVIKSKPGSDTDTTTVKSDKLINNNKHPNENVNGSSADRTEYYMEGSISEVRNENRPKIDVLKENIVHELECTDTLEKVLQPSLDRQSNHHNEILSMHTLSMELTKKRSRHSSAKSIKGWRTASLREHERQRKKLAKARERRATLVLGLIMVAFILCWFPFFTLYIITSLCRCIGDIVFAVVFWAGYCNSALNPIIYTVFNRDFRHAFHRILFVKLRHCQCR